MALNDEQLNSFEIKGLPRKQLKDLKRTIIEESALQVGYFQGVKAKMVELDPDIIQKTIASAGGWVSETLELEADKAMSNQPNEFDNVLVTEMVRNLNYQDFKEVAPFFFSYQRVENGEGQSEMVAEELEVSEEVKKSIEDGALERNIKFHIPDNLNQSLEADGFALLAYNPLTDLAIIISQHEEGQNYNEKGDLMFLDKNGELVGKSEEVALSNFNNQVIGSDILAHFINNNFDANETMQFKDDFVDIAIANKLKESGLSFSDEEIFQALSKPNRTESFDRLIDNKHKEIASERPRGPRI